MPKNSTISIRVDSEVKTQAGKILDAMGLSFSEAFNMMLHQIRIQRAIPFDIVAYSHIPRSESLAFIERLENGEEKLEGPFNSKEELWESLDI